MIPSWLGVISRQKIQRKAWPLFLILLFAVWWGGLTFYAVIVVPIGSDLTSSVEQGFVTQRVTYWHNWLLILVTACSWMEAFMRRRLLGWVVAVMLLAVATRLLFVHHHLSTLIDPAEQSVPAEFYRIHAAYLWLTTAEWLLGLVVAVIYVRDMSRLEHAPAS